MHLLLIDVFPPGVRDPQGIHGVIWENLSDQAFEMPMAGAGTLASYEAGGNIRAFVEHFSVGQRLPAMPLFLWRGGHIPMPLEATYNSAFAAVPRRWRAVLES